MYKKLLQLKTLLVLALLAMVGNSAWAEDVTDVLDQTLTGITGTSYTTFTGKKATSDAVYAGQCAGGNSSIQLRSNNNNSGVVTTTSGGKVKSITVKWESSTSNGRVLNVYGKNTAYTAATDLYNTSNQGKLLGTIVKGTSTSLTIDGDYEYIGFRSNSGAMYLTSVTIVWEVAGGSSTLTNNLALTGDPVELSFDLYNNAAPQVISYTTSSTGAVTIANNDYATFVVDQTNKTITVTPTVETPTTQTITVNQAADDTYAAGSVTFKLDVADSTPSGENWVETALADLTSTDVFVIVGNKGDKYYAMSNDNGTNSAPSAVEVTVSHSKITSKVTDDIKWTISGDATNGYTFYPAGSTDTWLYCTNTNNGVRVGTNDNKTFTVCTDGYLKHSGTSRYLGVYNSQDWRCYESINANITGQTFKFYRYDDGSTPSKANPELAFSSATAEASVGQPFTAPTLSTAAGFNGTVEYTSSDQTVARVMDTEAGTLEIVGGGTTTITATFAGNDDFKAGSASYTLTVTDNRIATTITQENIVLDVADVATLTKLAPVVKDADNNTVAYQYSEFPPEVSFEVVSDENAIIGSIGNNNGDITLNAVNGTATLKAYYNRYGVNSTYQPSECTFTITVESALENLAAFKALDDNETATVRLNNVKVLAVSGSQYIWLRDASGALLVYNSGLSYTAGQVLNGKMTAKKTTYHNQVETTGTIDGSNIVATDGDAAIPVEVDEADAVKYDSDLVKLSGVTVSGGVIAGENALTIYDGRFNLEYSFDETKTYNITGIIGKYNSTNQIYPISVEEVEGPAVPTITLSPATVNVEAAEANGTITVSYENFTPADKEVQFVESDGTTSATYDWLAADFDTDGNIEYMMEGNTATEARTAYLKVYALDDDANELVSNVVTITQAAYVDPNAKYNWVLTDLKSLTSGDVFVIVGDNGNTYALSNDKGTSAAPEAVEVTIVNNTLNTPEDKLKWNISGNAKDGYTFYPNGSTATWLYCTNTNNGVRVGTNDDNKTFTVKNDYLYNTATSRYIGVYNSTSTQDWRCYSTIHTNIQNQKFAFYKRVPVTDKTVMIDDEHYATLYHGTNLKIPSGVVAKTVTVDDEGILTVKDISGGVIPALTGVLLYAAESNNTEYTFNGTDDYSVNITDNNLTGVLTNQSVSEDGYVFFKLADGAGGLGFYYDQEGGTSINAKAGKAFLRVSNELALDIRGFVLSDARTGVAEFTMQKKHREAYDLQGRRVSTPKNGLYIINGKKVFVK